MWPVSLSCYSCGLVLSFPGHVAECGDLLGSLYSPWCSILQVSLLSQSFLTHNRPWSDIGWNWIPSQDFRMAIGTDGHCRREYALDASKADNILPSVVSARVRSSASYTHDNTEICYIYTLDVLTSIQAASKFQFQVKQTLWSIST